MQNPDIARLFDEVADLLEIQGANPFRVRAYRNAARVVRDYPDPLDDVVRSGGRDLTEIPGIGDDLAEKITAIVTTGELPLRKELAAQLPPGLLDLLRIPGLGPKRVKELHDKLHVTSATDLAQAVEAGRVEELKGFGPKMVEKIRAGLGQAERVERRLLLDEAETQATALVAYLKAGGGIRDLEVAGSYRRRRETVGDLDVLATCADGTAVMSRFAAYPDVAAVLAQGPTRAARSPWRASTGSPRSSQRTRFAATSRCTRPRATARRRFRPWRRRRADAATPTSPSQTTPSASPWRAGSIRAGCASSGRRSTRGTPRPAGSRSSRAWSSTSSRTGPWTSPTTRSPKRTTWWQRCITG